MMNSVARSLSKIGIFVKEAKGIEALLDSAEKDAMGFPRNADGVVDDPEFVDQVLCPVCDHEHGDQLFVKTGFVYVTCRQILARLRAQHAKDRHSFSELFPIPY